jgi:hypothetical protein
MQLRCLSGNSKETQGGYSAQETRIVDQRTKSSSFAQQCSTSQYYHNCESLELLGLRNSSTSTIQSWFGTVGLPSIPKHEKTPQRSALPFQWRCSKWCQEMVMYPGRIFFYEGLDKLMCCYDQVSKQTLWLCGDVKLIWDCISASWVTLYAVILFK